MKTTYAAAALALALATSPAAAQNVKITPLGSHPGELCANDRATIFEDLPVFDPYGLGNKLPAPTTRARQIHRVLSHEPGDHTATRS